MEDCVFCNIINRKEKAKIVFEDETCVVFVPLNPVSKGHVLVVPKFHHQDLFDIPEETFSKLAVIVQEISKQIVKSNEAAGVNLLHASGKDAQQSVFHFHFHVIPRFLNDGLDLWIKNSL